MSYTKLFSYILDSTVWRLPNEGRLVWITLLAMADRDGEVHASVPGLADRARVDRLYCDQALAMLMAPDPDSRTPDHEGRRIEKIDGGWRLINHAKYREKMDAEELKAKAAERQRRHRERKRASRDVTQSNAGHALSRDVTPVTTSEQAQAQSISDHKEISDVGETKPMGPAARMTAMNEKARTTVIEAARSRGTSPPQACSYPDHRDWCDLSRWALGVESTRADVTAEDALNYALAEWLDTDAAKHGFSAQWLAKNPNEYFLSECIARRAKGRELAEKRGS